MAKLATVLMEEVTNGAYDARLQEIYLDASRMDAERARYASAIKGFIDLYGDKEVEVYSAPGRSEVGGNHTDHQLGRVLAASVNIDTIAVVAPTADNCIHMKSEGYRPVKISLDQLEPMQKEEGTTAGLIRGVAAGMREKGYAIGGFEGYCVSEVMSGSGLSSSAAYEVMIGTIINGLYSGDAANSIEIAQISQMAENVYFGKPCGLLDQMACSVGGLITIDFADKENPVVRKVDVEFDDFGYSLCIVDTKGSHAGLTDEYAAVPAEMKKVAAYFGKNVLVEVPEEDFYDNYAAIRSACGDRAMLRAMHWYAETTRVVKQVNALESKDFDRFLALINESGDSSYEFLQNVYPSSNPQAQAVSIGIAMAKHILDGRGAARVHGGGFAGTMQAFVPNDMVAAYKEGMEKVFGEGSCYCLKVRPVGGVKVL